MVDKIETQQVIKLGVIGNPVKHSLSPQIHQQFARQFSHAIDYQKFELNDVDLEPFVTRFFDQGGVGLNVTLPYKQRLIEIVERLSAEAGLTRSVNTLFKDNEEKIVGDTTDGKGLLLDLARHSIDVAGKNLLIIGAGGAAASIVGALAKAGASISIYNRTQQKAEFLIEQFESIGKIALVDWSQEYDGVFSSISEFSESVFSQVQLNSTDGFCYDLNYGKRAKQLKSFVEKRNLGRFIDGFGMLIGQAAYSYQHWTGELPEINGVTLPIERDK